MISIQKLAPGMVVYDVRKEKAGNTCLSRIAVRSVKIVFVDPEFKFVEASWNCNPVKRFYPKQGKFTWRKDEPILVKTASGWSNRLETKEEKKIRIQKQKEQNEKINETC